MEFVNVLIAFESMFELHTECCSWSALYLEAERCSYVKRHRRFGTISPVNDNHFSIHASEINCVSPTFQGPIGQLILVHCQHQLVYCVTYKNYFVDFRTQQQINTLFLYHKLISSHWMIGTERPAGGQSTEFFRWVFCLRTSF